MSNQIIKVNGKEIIIATFENEKYVAIKSVCDAIKVNYSTQYEKLKNDESIVSDVPLRGITAADGKLYKMRVIPLRFVFGWLYTINPHNVNPDIKQSFINYRRECYIALFDHFTKRTSILKEKTNLQIEIETLEKELEEDNRIKKIKKLKSAVKNASQRLNDLDKNVVNEQLDLFKENNDE